MPNANCCECFTPDDGVTHYSKESPSRCVVELLFGFAMYIRDGVNGIRKGITDQTGAFNWLKGRELSEIKHYKVVT